MDEVKLLNRTDTKFVLKKSILTSVLSNLTEDYKVLSIKGKRSAAYKTLYFDDKKFSYYLHHHNRKPNRYKVRMRKYVDSDLCFFEIKHKVKERTDKSRIRIPDFNLNLEKATLALLKDILPDIPELQPSLWNSFERITLVNNKRKERVTIDVGLNFQWENETKGYPDVVIIEVKQEEFNRVTPIIKTLRKYGIRQKKMSKYCIGLGLLHPVKTNRFKEKYIHLNKLQYVS